MAGGRARFSAERSAQWRRAIDDAKQRHNISDVVAKDRKVVKAGKEWKALCAFHDERSPSMQLNNAKGTFYCFGCAASGDIVSYVMHRYGLGFVDALKWLGAADLPEVDPRERARAAAEDAAERAAAIADAREVWARCTPIAGTAGERYLREVRGITAPLPPVIRFGLVPTSRDDAGNWKPPYPAVVMACTGEAGELVGLQRIFITDDGRDKRWGKRSKLSLGRPRGAGVRLSYGDEREIVLCEGPEDGLSLMQEMPGRAVWVALGTAMMPEMGFPTSVRRVVIAGQNDDAGRAAATKAAEAIAVRGFAVRSIFPDPAYKDWNDQLRGVRR